MLRHTSFHGRQRRLKVAVDKGTRTNDSIVVLKDGTMAKVVGVDGQVYKTHPIVLTPYKTDNIGLTLPWGKVGVYK